MRTQGTEPKQPQTQKQGNASASTDATSQATSTTMEEEYSYLHPLVRQAIKTFERDREKHLTEGHSERDWVAYHGERLLGIAENDIELYQRCAKEKIPVNEVFFHTLHSIVRRAYISG